MNATTILVVEDEEALATLLKYNLEKAGYQVLEAQDGDEALILVKEEAIDLTLLDWMLPNTSGLEVCRQIRQSPSNRNLPIIMLTARGEETDRVRGLETGADDFITKPFSVQELLARIASVLRRAHPEATAEMLGFEEIVMDTASHKVTRFGRAVKLGPIEFRLLRHLLENPRRVFSRNQLIDAVWGRDTYIEDRTVDVHIRRLRQALNGDDFPDIIRTVRSAGYALDTESI